MSVDAFERALAGLGIAGKEKLPNGQTEWRLYNGLTIVVGLTNEEKREWFKDEASYRQYLESQNKETLK